MPQATENLVSLLQESSRSCLDDILRDGAREMLGTAIEAEVAHCVGARAELVCNGHLPERSIQTPMVRDSDQRVTVIDVLRPDGMLGSSTGHRACRNTPDALPWKVLASGLAHLGWN